jgi:type I restriction-modification system DNA methylase subunit
MSNEILNDSQLEVRSRSFWNYIRHNSHGISPHHVHEIVGAMAFAFERSDFIMSLEERTPLLRAEIRSFCDSHRQGGILEYAFHSLWKRMGDRAFSSLLIELAQLSSGISSNQFRYLATQILNQAPDRNRADACNFVVSKEIAQLMLRLTDDKSLPNSNILVPYVPHPSIPSMVVKAASMRCYVPSLEAAAVMAVHELIQGGSAEVHVVDVESRSSWFNHHRNCSRIIAAPPFLKRLTNHWSGCPDSETFCVDQIAQNLMGPHALAAICIPPGFLFRSSPPYIRLKRSLIESGLIEAVIQLPERLFGYTSIASAIIVLRSGKIGAGKIRVIDATDCTLGDERRPILDVEKVMQRVNDPADQKRVRSITDNQLEVSGYDLTPARYLVTTEAPVPEGHTSISLAEVLRASRTILPRDEDQGILMERRSFPDTTAGFEFSFEEYPLVKASELQRGSSLRKITSSCLLVDTMAFRGEIRGFWFSHKGRDLFVRPDIRPMEVDSSRADPRWLAMAINSKEISDQVKFLITGNGTPRLRIELLLNMRIALPDSLEEQGAIVRSAEELQIKAKAKEIGFEKLLQQQQDDFLRDIRLKKHTLSQIARDIRSRVSVIKKALEKSGKLAPDQQIGRQETPLLDYLDHIARRCDDMGTTLESLTKIHVFSPLEELSLETAFKALETFCKGRHFKLETSIHEDSFKDQETGNNLKPIIHLAAKDFTELCENIFDNAERHGFQDEAAENLIRIDAFLDTKEQMVVVSFKNTGKPLPDGLTIDRFVIRGEKGGSTGNTGIGGHHIKSLMDHANGKVDIRNLAEDFFQVEIKLSFPFQP